MKESLYKLIYFNVRGLGEPIRWIFRYKKIPFEDYRVEWNYPKWFMQDKKKLMKYGGQMPILIFKGKEQKNDDKFICQSIPISKYLAKEFGLIGKNNFEEAQAEEITSMAYELFIDWRTRLFEGNPKRRELLGKGFFPGLGLDARMKICYSKWDKILEKNKSKYYFGDEPTYTDFWTASMISIWNEPLSGEKPVVIPIPGKDSIPIIDEKYNYLNLVNDFKYLKEHYERVQEIPEIKSWINERPKTCA